MLECPASARDKWRPTLLAIAESVHIVRLNKNGQEETDGFEGGAGDEMAGAEEPEMDGNAEEKQ